LAKGIEKGVLYRKTEGLLQEYRAMQARLSILETELFELSGCEPGETQEEAISGMSFTRVISDMPRGNDVSDKTGRVAVEWREKYGKEFSRAWEMYVTEYQAKRFEITSLVGVIKKIDTALGSLLQKERNVVELYYIQGMKWEDIGKKIHHEQGHCKRIRDRAVWYMSKSMWGKWDIR
jgi:hypothetical protein